jgi:hypothetical protein
MLLCRISGDDAATVGSETTYVLFRPAAGQRSTLNEWLIGTIPGRGKRQSS